MNLIRSVKILNLKQNKFPENQPQTSLQTISEETNSETFSQNILPQLLSKEAPTNPSQPVSQVIPQPILEKNPAQTTLPINLPLSPRSTPSFRVTSLRTISRVVLRGTPSNPKVSLPGRYSPYDSDINAIIQNRYADRQKTANFQITGAAKPQSYTIYFMQMKQTNDYS
jgi:hypothetical protein